MLFDNPVRNLNIGWWNGETKSVDENVRAP